MPDLREQLEHCFQGRVCLAGVGNVEWGDDGFGVRLAEALAADLRFAICDLRILVAGNAPERCLAELSGAAYDHVIFLDAVEFGGAPGSVVFLDTSEMAARFPQISTHKISLGTLANWVEANGRTRAWLLGAQPESLKPAVDLSPAVRRTLDSLAALLTELAQQQRASVLDCGGPPPPSPEAGPGITGNARAAGTGALLHKRQRAGAVQNAGALSGDAGICAQPAIP